MNTYFELHYGTQKKDNLAIPSSVYVALKRPPQNEQGKLLLSPMLMSEAEIDYTFGELINELQLLWKKAKKGLK